MERTPKELRNLFWEEDRLLGGVIKEQYCKIKEVLETNDFSWVEERYKKIKEHAIQATDYYKNYSANDEFPVVNKTSILENYEAHKAKFGFDTPIHISSTSGSTGTPFSVIQDYKKRKRTIADLKVFGELCDYPSHERMVFFRVLNEKLHRTPEQEEKENIYYIDSSNLSENHLEQMRKKLLELKPRIVFSYSSTLVELAKYVANKKIPQKFSLRSVLVGGEGISEENRKLLESVFGCKVYRRYFDMELGILGQDNGDGGNYILNWGSYYFECLKLDSNTAAGPGEVGRIVVTDLFNKALPMIRYDTGDLGIMEYAPENKFPFFKEIYGRKRDCIYTTNGDLLSPAKIFVLMWGSKDLHQWQFIQEAEKDYVLKLNVKRDFDVSVILDKLKNVIGEDARIQIEYVNDIPITSSNKRRAVICNYKKEDDNL